ncbi:uncharacterized protein LOC144360004 [Saccoglossus kowalevskii]
MSRFDLLFLSFFAIASRSAMSDDTYQLGFFVPLDTMCSDSVSLDIAAGGFHLAIDEINNQGLVPGVQLNYTWTNVPNTTFSLTTMADHWDAGFKALIGTGCDCLHVARTATSLYFTIAGYNQNYEAVVYSSTTSKVMGQALIGLEYQGFNFTEAFVLTTSKIADDV